MTLLPQALSITIPMAVLLGILIGFGRLSADREFVALQACGVSLYRLLRPIAPSSRSSPRRRTAYEMIVALPGRESDVPRNHLQRVASRVESNVKPRVFFEEFPNRVIYVRDVAGAAAGTTSSSPTRRDPAQTTVYFAREGRLHHRPREAAGAAAAAARHAAHHARGQARRVRGHRVRSSPTSRSTRRRSSRRRRIARRAGDDASPSCARRSRARSATDHRRSRRG